MRRIEEGKTTTKMNNQKTNYGLQGRFTQKKSMNWLETAGAILAMVGFSFLAAYTFAGFMR